MSKAALKCRIWIIRELVRRLGSEHAVHLWLNTPHPHFAERCPRDFLDEAWRLGFYIEIHKQL